MFEYATARKVLLDALEALGPQRSAVILCGAQAVYAHVGEDTLAVSPFTSDADLALEPALLLDEPLVQTALEKNGFRLTDSPGIWRSAEGVELDLLVPAALGGAGRRSAKLGPPHGDHIARKVHGLEAVLVDHAPVALRALDPADARVFDVEVAGPAALIVAKLHKLADRLKGSPTRVRDKDALDLFRVLRAVDTATLASDLDVLARNPASADVTGESLRLFRRLFGSDTSDGVKLLLRATELLEDPDEMRVACVTLAVDLLNAVSSDVSQTGSVQ